MPLAASESPVGSINGTEEVELHDMPASDRDASDHEPLISHSDRGHNESPSSPSAEQPQLKGIGNVFVWTLTLSACVSGLLFGYDTGVISSTLVSIGTDLSNRKLTNLDKGLITSSTSAFALLASPVAGILADRIGRKNIIVCADVLFVLGALWQAYTNTVAGMIAGRAVVGLAIGSASLIAPLYISELAPSHLRGRMVTVTVLFITGGQVIAYIIGYLFSTMSGGWRWMVGLGALPALLQICMLAFMPETPRYLCKQQKQTEAKRIVTKIHKGLTFDPSALADSIISAINREITEEQESRLSLLKDRPEHASRASFLPPTLHSLLTHPPHRRALTITCMLQALQQACGFNSLMYFSATIFQLLNFASPTLTSLSIALTNFLFTIIAFNLIDRVGRRRILLLTIPIMVLALLLCAASFTFLSLPDLAPGTPTSTQHNRPGAAIAILTSLILYVSAFATGLGVIPWTQSELFPLSVRGVGSGIATAANWGCNTVVGLTFLPMMQGIGAGWTFVVYAGVCAVGWVGIWRIYPELSGLRLEEVGRVLAEGWGVR